VVVYLAMIVMHAPGLGQLPRQAIPGIGWLIELLPLTEEVYIISGTLGIVFALVSAIGYRTRLFMVLNAFTIFYVMAAPNFFGKLWHQQLPIWISWILACSPCFDVLSLDSKFKKVDDKGLSYGFHLKIIWLQFGLIYFWAGFYKLWDAGFDWALADTVVNLITIEWFEHYDLVPPIRIDHYPGLIMIGALLTIVFELLYTFLLLNKITKWISIIGGLVMHNVLGLLMYISFFHLLQVFYVVFVPWNAVVEKLWPKLKPQSGPAQDKIRLVSPAYLLPILIVSANAMCGVFKVNSYPFSIYPVYTDVVPDTISYFDYRIIDAELKSLDFREEAKKSYFRWEDYSRMEYEIIRNYRNDSAIDTNEVITMLNRWKLGVPTLQEVDSVDVYIRTTPVAPESRDEVLNETYVLTITPKNPNAH
jgi:hypothetical protein